MFFILIYLYSLHIMDINVLSIILHVVSMSFNFIDNFCNFCGGRYTTEKYVDNININLIFKL